MRLPPERTFREQTPYKQRASFGCTYIKIGTIQRRLAWPLRKDDTQIREAFQILSSFISSSRPNDVPVTLSVCASLI